MPKMDPELKNALARAHDEIILLRNRLADAEPKAHAYDTLAQFARLSVPYETRSMTEDVASRIRKMLEADDAIPASESAE